MFVWAVATVICFRHYAWAENEFSFFSFSLLLLSTIEILLVCIFNGQNILPVQLEIKKNIASKESVGWYQNLLYSSSRDPLMDCSVIVRFRWKASTPDQLLQ